MSESIYDIPLEEDYRRSRIACRIQGQGSADCERGVEVRADAAI